MPGSNFCAGLPHACNFILSKFSDIVVIVGFPELQSYRDKVIQQQQELDTLHDLLKT